jgi:two-component system phosphate regulon sensor histidine kinase PhoR
MKRRDIRSQLIMNSLALILLPLGSFAAYSFWQVYNYNPEEFTQLLFVLSIAFGVTLILAILLSVNLSEKFIAPIEKITTAARRIASGRLSERVHVRSGNEIDVLALALNHLASRLEDKIEEISAEKQKLQLILEHMDNAVMLFDFHGCLLEANRSSFLWFRLSPSMVGQHNLNILGNSQIDIALKEALNSGQLQQHTFRTNFQGSKKIFQASLIPLPRKAGSATAVLAVFHDITSLQLIQERQADFVANASHELSTPLTAIRGFAETLVDGAAENAEDSRHFAGIILSEAARMQRLVQDLLQLAKIESVEYRQQFHCSPTQVQPLLKSIAHELSPSWTRKQLTLSMELPDQPIWVLTDPDQLKQVLVNLIDNAIKYTPDNGTILVSAMLQDGQIQFIVKDSGIGIPSEDLPRIFDRFYRIDKARTRSISGTGLGLAIVKHILDALGGTIEVESQPHNGTTFRFYLPDASQESVTNKPVA